MPTHTLAGGPYVMLRDIKSARTWAMNAAKTADHEESQIPSFHESRKSQRVEVRLDRVRARFQTEGDSEGSW